MGFLHKGTVVLVVSETGVDMVIVRAGITVIGLMGLVVFQGGSEPDSGGAKIGNVIQVVDYALEVTSVAGNRVIAVYGVSGARNVPGAGGTVEILPCHSVSLSVKADEKRSGMMR